MDSFAHRRKIPYKILARALSFAVLFVIAKTIYLITITTTTTTASAGNRFSGDVDTHNELVKYYSSIFHDFLSNKFISPESKTLAMGTHVPHYIAAMNEIGVFNSTAIFRYLRLPFANNTFDFEFSDHSGIDSSPDPAGFSSEVSRTLKPGGYLIIHTKSQDLYSLHSLLNLFNFFTLIQTREIEFLKEIVLKKEIEFLTEEINDLDSCSVPLYKRELIRKTEPLITIEPLKPWITFKKNLKNFKYLPSMADIRFKKRYIYIDVGARRYGSSIGSFFKKQYPKQNKSFEIFAIESDKSFENKYKSKKKITLLPFAAWVRNESLFFEINREPKKKNDEKGKGMGRIQSAHTSSNFMGDLNKIQGFDFAIWLKNSFTEKDFVVVKMDVEGTEFYLIPRLIETGAICLIDEMFLECHYNQWEKCCEGQRSSKFQKSYEECLELFRFLRENGVLVHQWW